jgi:hypothetical protein
MEMRFNNSAGIEQVKEVSVLVFKCSFKLSKLLISYIPAH